MRHPVMKLARRITPKRFRKVLLDELVAALPAEQRDDVCAGVDNAPTPFIPALSYTEARPEWVALYEHCRRGQIDPSIMRRMRDIDLEYLAASPPVDLDRVKAEGVSRGEQALIYRRSIKLQANVTRATRELQRRYTLRIGATIAALSLLLSVATTRLL
jgi:hypothetical protein